jgi:7-cyano-7-deazaguanine synthase
MPKSVVLLSGGLDSTVALGLACWRDGATEVLAVTLAYGQRHINELTHARAIAAAAGVPCFVMHIDPAPWKLLPLCTGRVALDRTRYAMATGGVSDAFLPGRNVAFLAAALTVAGIQGAERIWIGANADDTAGFPDCRPPFFWAWQQMASHALGRPVHLEAPLLDLTKPKVVALARRMAIDLDATWSCYRPQFAPTGVIQCGRCDACILRAAAIAEENGPGPALANPRA